AAATPTARRSSSRSKRMTGVNLGREGPLTQGGARPLAAELLHQVLHLRAVVPTAYEEGKQSALAHPAWQPAELADAPHRDGARLDPRIDALVVERAPNRGFGRATLHALGEQVADQAGRPPPSNRAQRGV